MISKKKKFIAIIPARSGSKGLKNKNILNVSGHPLISYSIQAAKESKFINKIFVTTDGEKIAKISKSYGAEVIKRPKKLSGDKLGIELVVVHAVGEIEKRINFIFDNIVLLQPTSPLRSAKDIDRAISIFIKKKSDSLFSSVNLHPLFWTKKNTYMPTNYNVNKRPNRQQMDETLIENGSIYISKKKIYKNKNNRLGGKISTYTMKNFSVFEVDSKEDLDLMSILIPSKKLKKIICKPKKIL